MKSMSSNGDYMTLPNWINKHKHVHINFPCDSSKHAGATSTINHGLIIFQSHNS